MRRNKRPTCYVTYKIYVMNTVFGLMKKGMPVLCMALLASAFAATKAQAQTFIVRGALQDSLNNEALEYANCVLLRSTDSSFAYGTVSGDKGQFVFKNVDTGHYLLRVSVVGYVTCWKAMDIRSNTSLGTLRLMKNATSLKTLTVKGERPMYSTDGEKNLYNTSEDPSIQTGNASDALQNAPGVEVDAEGNITLRGVSSVEIWINDRPTHMNEEALKQYIKQLPANAIDRIEVITNPSARYNSSGGVINIITNQKIKRNELVCFGTRASTLPSISPWISYVWANEKIDFNFYLNGRYGYNESKRNGSSTLLTDNGDTSRYQEYATASEGKSSGGYAGLNFDWHIDSMTEMGVWIGGYPNWSNSSSRSDYIYHEYLPLFADKGYSSLNEVKSGSGGGNFGAWFEHSFDTMGRKVNMNLYNNLWRNNGNSITRRTYNDPRWGSLDRQNDYAWRHFGTGLDIDFSLPFKHDFELETGVELGYGSEKGDDRLDSLDHATGIYQCEELRCTVETGHDFELSGYLTAQKRWGNLTVKLGLRAEETWMHDQKRYLNQSTASTVDTAYFGLVPSIHLSYRTQSMHNFSLSYTRRYSTPDASQLTSFIEYGDYSYSTGNPNLTLSYSHNLEASWNKYFTKFGSIGMSAYFRANTNSINSLTDVAFSPYHNAWVNYSYPVNVGNSHTEGISANATYRPTGFFNLRFNASLYNYYYSTLYRGGTVSDSKVSYSLRLNLWTKVWKKLEIFANTYYSSPQMGFYSLGVARKGLDFGCSADFFERKMSVYLNINDIFGWTQWGENSTNPYYSTTGSTTYNSRSVSLGLTFRFGKMELEGKARQGGAGNEGGMR